MKLRLHTSILTVLMMLAFVGVSWGQTGSVSGNLTDDAGEALIGANVVLTNTSTDQVYGTVTDIDGGYSIGNLPYGAYNMNVSYIGYADYNTSFDLNQSTMTMTNMVMKEGGVDLVGVVVTGTMDIVRDRRTPVAVSTINMNEIQAKGVGNVEFPEIMKNTPSIYVSNQTGFGDSQMFTRGFDQINTAFLLNGQPINGMEDGRMYWSNWSGMSDVASAVQIQRGLGSSKLAISSVGGTVNIVTRTIEQEKGGFIRTIYGNDNYIKGTVSYNSGLKGKWAYSLLLDHWQADDKWAEGTRGQGQNYLISVGFKPNHRNTFNFLITGAPQSHGQRWSQSEEDLREKPRFNQHWGYDGDEWKSERFNYYHKPVMNLSWDNKISDKTSLASVLYASFGRGGGTGPFGSSSNRIRTEDGQIDFSEIRKANLADSDGIGSFSDNYARRASVNNHTWFGNITTLERQLSDVINLSGGFDFRFYRGDHFRQLVDLFGLNSYQDSFRHETRDSDYTVSSVFKANPWSSLSNFASEEERVAYDYSENINYQGVFGQLEYDQNAFTTFVQAAISNQSYQREGRWADQGKSEKISKTGYNIKGGASYSFNEENTLFVNAGYYSRQPFLDNIFNDIRYSNDLIGDNIENESVLGYELGYKFLNNNFSANINLYNTTWGNRALVSTFDNDNGTPDDETDDFTQRNVERGIEQSHKGFEIDVKYKLDRITIKGMASIGDWKFSKIESVQAFNDDTGVIIAESSGEDLSDIHVPNAPQTSLGLGVELEIIDRLNIHADYNFYDNLYRRDNFNEDENFLRQEIGTLPSYSLLDAGASYSLPLGARFLKIGVNVYNILDNFYLNQTDPYGVLNGNGLTWNTSLKYTF